MGGSLNFYNSKDDNAVVEINFDNSIKAFDGNGAISDFKSIEYLLFLSKKYFDLYSINII